MKSNFGDCFQLSLFGESHSDAIGVTIGGLAAGIPLDLDYINKQLTKRKPHGRISTTRGEEDEFHVLSGFFNGKTTGTPICIMIENKTQRSGDYEKTKQLARPSHADYTGFVKYDGFGDYRGGGHFSGRLTAPIVAAGAIASQILSYHNIVIATHIKSLRGVCDSRFSTDLTVLERQADLLNDSLFPTLDKEAKRGMTAIIEEAARDGDSVGGILETVILNIEPGIGEPFFNSVEAKLSSLLFSVPAVKGVEFGAGFGICDMLGSEANDSLYSENGRVYTKSNNNGGINGGITNGMPVLFKTAIKPTSSIYKKQETINLETLENDELQIKGRHDPAIIHRARVVVDSVAAIALLDLFCERYGTVWTKSMK